MYVSVGILHVSVGILQNTYSAKYLQNTIPTYAGYLSVSDNYLWVFYEWELYVQVKLAGRLRKD